MLVILKGFEFDKNYAFWNSVHRSTVRSEPELLAESRSRGPQCEIVCISSFTG